MKLSNPHVQDKEVVFCFPAAERPVGQVPKPGAARPCSSAVVLAAVLSCGFFKFHFPHKEFRGPIAGLLAPFRRASARPFDTCLDHICSGMTENKCISSSKVIIVPRPYIYY